jgi:plasmid maintenance system antidote protein VapI
LPRQISVSPEIWLDLQSDYDLRLVQRTTWPEIEPHIRKHAA